MLYLTERFGLPAVLGFFRGAARDHSLATTRARLQAALGVTLEEAEAEWLDALRQ